MEVANEADGEMEDVPMPSSATSESPREEAEQPANKRVTRLSQRNVREASVDMLSEENGSVSSQVAYRTPQSGISSSSSVSGSTARTSTTQIAKEDAPPLDEQIATITKLAQQPQTDGMKGYVMSGVWLQEAQNRGTAANKSSKQKKEEALPPVNNQGLVLKAEGIVPDLVDEKGDKFYPLKPGQELGKEIEILPEEAWHKIVAWHGMEHGSPEIVRYCHNTTIGPGSENIQYELYPPIFTILKLPWRSEGLTTSALREKELKPAMIAASRHEGFQDFLKRAKASASIKPETRVRLWRILGDVTTTATQGGMLTPAQSRSNSPAPGVLQPIDLGNKLVLDTHTFLNLHLESQRELIDVKDQTNNSDYKGSSNLDLVGLGQEGVIVLEEQNTGPAGGEFVTDSVKSDATKHGLSKNALSASSAALKVKSSTTSGRTSPAPTGIMTRGRAQRSGRIRGVVGLGNLGNTCYMNSALQCVRSVKELTYYFLDGKYKEELNPKNPLSHNGDVAKVYATLLREIYQSNTSSISPRAFKQTIGRYGPSFSGYGQQDSQEFLLFLLDGLQEDLNRIHKKPYIEKPDSTDEMVHNQEALKQMADRCWEIYKARNDSVITDLFAGMYKSTLHCPVCDKTSIIFDPFNNLTLQLPIENIWSRKLTYFPLRSRPIELDVDIDKHATWYQLKEHVARKMEVDPKKIVTAEIYKHRFFKMFDDRNPLTEDRLADTDQVTLFEVDQIPTNWPSPKKQPKVRSLLNYQDSDEDQDLSEQSPRAERMLVPIFNRMPRDTTSRQQHRVLFAAPTYITLNREEAKDEDEILRKVLGKVATLTTREILRDEGERSDNENDEDDVVVMNTEDADSSSESKINADSVHSEESMVDVSMQDADEAIPRFSFPPMPKITKFTPRVLQPGEPIKPELRNLFEICLFKTSSEGPVPTGWSSLQDENKKYLPLSNRISKKSKTMQRKREKSAGQQLKDRLANNGSSTESSDEDSPLPSVQDVLRENKPDSSASTSDDEDRQQNGPRNSVNSAFSRFNKRTSRDRNSRLITYSRKARRQKPLVSYEGTASEDEDPPIPKKPLIKLGEGIILDWNMQGYDALFSGSEPATDDEFSEGAPTWNTPSSYPDRELAESRATRSAKKKNGISLEDCLNEFRKEEILSENDAWYCPRCKEHRRASKKFELWTVPDILVIHLKRFSSEGRLRDKVDAYVDFPVEDLDMNERVVVREEGRDLIYDLFAVDNHYGGLGGGHYTAFAKSFDDDQWYEYNDSMASKRGNPQLVVTSAAYILFYRRRTSTALGGSFFEKILHEVDDPEGTSAPGSTNQSRNPSPGAAAGEGRRLEDSSRGFSSASREAEAALQAGNGGEQQGVRTRGGAGARRQLSTNSTQEMDEEELPEYAAEDPNPVQSMEVDEDLDGFNRPILSFDSPPGWGFGRLDGSVREDSIGEGGYRSRGNPGTPDDDNDSTVANVDGADSGEIPWDGFADGSRAPSEADGEVVEIRIDEKEE